MNFTTRSFCVRLQVAALLLLALLLSRLPAVAQVTWTNPVYVTNLTVPVFIGAAGNSNVIAGTFTSQPVTVRPGYGAGIDWGWWNASTTATTNAGLFLNLSRDGTNWPNPALYTIFTNNTALANWTNQFSTNFPAALLDSYYSWRIEGFTNMDTAHAITNSYLVLHRSRLDYGR